jgi:hypothetical protein
VIHPPHDDGRLGVVVSTDVVPDGVTITVRFDSDEKLALARRICDNLDKLRVDLHDDHIMVGLATKDFDDGP